MALALVLPAADAAGAGAYAGPAYPPGAGAAGRGDEDFGRSGRVLFNLGSDGHRLCLRRAAYQMVPATSQTAAEGGKRYKNAIWKG